MDREKFRKTLIVILFLFLAVFLMTSFIGEKIESDKINKEEVKKMTDKEIKNVDEDKDLDKMTDSAKELYYKRSVDLVMNDNKETYNEDNNKTSEVSVEKFEKYNEREKEIKNILDETLESDMEDSYNYFNDHYRPEVVMVNKFNDKFIAYIDIGNSEDSKITDTENLKDTDLSIYSKQILEGLKDRGVFNSTDKVILNLKTNSLKNNGDLYITESKINKNDKPYSEIKVSTKNSKE